MNADIAVSRIVIEIVLLEVYRFDLDVLYITLSLQVVVSSGYISNIMLIFRLISFL